MKKFLFSATAMVAAVTALSSAQASDPIKLGLGGYMQYMVVAADQDDDYTSANGKGVNNVDVLGDAEVFFTGETTLDNGMTIGVEVTLEAGTQDGDDDIDQSYMYLQGKYGKLIVGSTDDVAKLSSVMAPSVSELSAAGDGSDLELFLLQPVSNIEVAQTQSDDANKLSYYTPTFYGVQAGVSYTPSNNVDGDDAGSSNVNRVASFDNIWSSTLTYTGTVSGVGISAAANYAIADDNTVAGGARADMDRDVQNIGGGLQLSYQGFTFGGGVMRQVANSATVDGGAGDGFAYNVGLSYEEGPYGVSATYYKSEVEGDHSVKGDDELAEYQLAGTYALGAGVELFGEIDYLDADKEGDNSAAAGNEGAVGAAVGLHLDF